MTAKIGLLIWKKKILEYLPHCPTGNRYWNNFFVTSTEGNISLSRNYGGIKCHVKFLLIIKFHKLYIKVSNKLIDVNYSKNYLTQNTA